MSRDLYFPTENAKLSWYRLMLAIEQSPSADIADFHVSRAKSYLNALFDVEIVDRDEYLSYSEAIKRAKAKSLQLISKGLDC
jgi:hypothetical protein